MPEPRLCEVCSLVIPKWKAKNVSTCSVACKFQRKDAEAKKKREVRSQQKQRNGYVLFHNCLFGGGGEIDPFVPSRCKCRKLVSEEKAQILIARGEALDLETRTPAFTGGAIIQIGKLKRTGRSATVEKAHISRLVEKPEKKAREKTKTFEELQAAVQQDKADRFEEERLRLEIYGELTASARRAWIKEIPSDEYDKAERRDWGRALFTNYKEGRTAGGIGVDADRPLWNGEFEDLGLETELCDDETDTEKDEEIEESDDAYEETRNE